MVSDDKMQQNGGMGTLGKLKKSKKLWSCLFWEFLKNANLGEKENFTPDDVILDKIHVLLVFLMIRLVTTNIKSIYFYVKMNAELIELGFAGSPAVRSQEYYVFFCSYNIVNVVWKQSCYQRTPGHYKMAAAAATETCGLGMRHVHFPFIIFFHLSLYFTKFVCSCVSLYTFPSISHMQYFYMGMWTKWITPN